MSSRSEKSESPGIRYLRACRRESLLQYKIKIEKGNHSLHILDPIQIECLTMRTFSAQSTRADQLPGTHYHKPRMKVLLVSYIVLSLVMPTPKVSHGRKDKEGRGSAHM